MSFEKWFDENYKTVNDAAMLLTLKEVAFKAWQAALQSQWKSIETAPKDGRTVLLGYFNDFNKWRTMRGQWFSKNKITEDWKLDDIHATQLEGWFETSVESDDEYNQAWNTVPTHWQPLPPPPKL